MLPLILIGEFSWLSVAPIMTLLQQTLCLQSKLLVFLQTLWNTCCTNLSYFFKPSFPFHFKGIWQLFIPSKSLHPSSLHQYFSSHYEGRQKSSERSICGYEILLYLQAWLIVVASPLPLPPWPLKASDRPCNNCSSPLQLLEDTLRERERERES